ncbi:MAG: S8 family serine peptidase, partial [Bacteroidota bacterium]
ATKSKFLLARVTPQFGGLKMLNDAQWIAALEWADEQGASVINSSLSFTNQIFSRNEMDGMSTRLSKIANTAASKGIVVVNAAGNEYEGSWEIIGAPADAPEVLTVGSVSLKNFLKSSFSSVGPTSDGRLKPDLCAVGELYTGGSQIEFSSGTSFATPLVTGFVACVQELFPYQSATETLSLMRKAGHLYPYFDYAHGYGIPQASYFLPEFKKDSLLQIISSNFVKIQKVKIDSINFTFEAFFNNDSIVYDVFKELINSTNNTSSLNGYFSILNSEGNIDSYGFDRLRAEVKNDAGLVIENTEEYAAEVKDYHFLFNSIEYSTCDSCILRVRFLNDIKDFTLDEE